MGPGCFAGIELECSLQILLEMEGPSGREFGSLSSGNSDLFYGRFRRAIVALVTMTFNMSLHKLSF